MGFAELVDRIHGLSPLVGQCWRAKAVRRRHRRVGLASDTVRRRPGLALDNVTLMSRLSPDMSGGSLPCATTFTIHCLRRTLGERSSR